MKRLFWNIRGVNKRYKQKEVKNLLKNKKVDLVGIVETRVKAHKATQISANIASVWGKLHNYNSTENGRIWILWDTRHYYVSLLKEEMQLIQCQVRSLADGEVCLITVVYGYNTASLRLMLWDQL